MRKPFRSTRKEKELTAAPIITIKPKEFYSIPELFQRGWGQNDIEKYIPDYDKRTRNGFDKKGRVKYKLLYEMDKIHQIETTKEFRSGRAALDNSLSFIYEDINKRGQKRFFGSLGDGRKIGVTYGVGFLSKDSLHNFYSYLFSPVKQAMPTNPDLTPPWI